MLKQSGSQQMVVNCCKPGCALRVKLSHIVQAAVAVPQESSSHSLSVGDIAEC